MDLSKSETSALYQNIERSSNYQPATDAYLSINIDGLLGQALCPSFLEWESEVSPSSSSLCCSSSSLHSSEGRNFLFDGDLHPSQCEKCVDNVRDTTVSVDTFSFKGMPVDATTSADNQKCKHSNCGFKVKNVFSEIEPTSESNESGEVVNLKVGRQKERTNQLSALSADISFPNNISKSDRLESLQNSVVLPFISHGQFERIPCHAEFDTCRDSAISMQRNTNSLVHNAQTEMDLRDKMPNSSNACISEKQVSKVDLLSNQRETNQSNSLKRSQTEVAPGWRKPPRPPRQTKPEANSIHSNPVSDASHTYRGKKLQKLHGKKKMKAEGCPPNLTLCLALVFTFCFCLLIASSRK